MINKEIIINKKSRAITNGENGDLFRLGVDGENLQENIIFKFEDEFVNGTARIEITMQDNTKSYVMIDKVNQTYVLPVKSILTKTGLNKMQLVITQGTDDEEIPIFKSQMFNFFIAESINADTEQPAEYPQWIDKANTTLNEIDNFDIEAVKELNEATITITDRYGISKSVQVFDGTDGTNGKDAKINGVNTLRMVAGTNITLEQEDDTLTINSQGGGSGGTSDYTELTNKPTINNVELTGNKTTSDLGIVIPVVPTNVSAFTNDVGYLTQHQDISGKQDKIDSSHKLSADLVDDTSTTNKFTNATEKATWNAKSDFSGSYSDLTNKPNLDIYNISRIKNDDSTNRFNFDSQDLGNYVVNQSGGGFYYKANNTDGSLTSKLIFALKYIKKVSEASTDEKIAEIIYVNTQTNATKGDIMVGDILKGSSNLYVGNTSQLTSTDRKIKVITNSYQEIDGQKAFNSYPTIKTYSVPTGDTEFAPKKYVDDSIASAITTTLGGSY